MGVSQARKNLNYSLNQVKLLFNAHSVLTQLHRAQRQLVNAQVNLQQTVQVLATLVNQPGPGRPANVNSLNQAAILLLSASLEAYIEDVFTEAAKKLLADKVQSVDTLIERALSTFSNPHSDRIENLFASIGMPAVMSSLSWQKTSNVSVKRRLANYIKLRNQIAHGTQASIRKSTAVAFSRFVQNFADRFDDQIKQNVQSFTGSPPW